MMSAALALDSRQVETVTRVTEAPRVSELRELTEALREMTRAIKFHWEEMSSSDQAAFRRIAQVLENPPHMNIWERLRFAYTVLRAGRKVFMEYMDAAIKFQDALLGRLAREKQAFERVMHDDALFTSVEQGWIDIEAGNTLSLQEVMKCLEQD